MVHSITEGEVYAFMGAFDMEFLVIDDVGKIFGTTEHFYPVVRTWR